MKDLQQLINNNKKWENGEKKNKANTILFPNTIKRYTVYLTVLLD